MIAQGLGTVVEYSTGWLKDARGGRIAVVKKIKFLEDVMTGFDLREANKKKVLAFLEEKGRLPFAGLLSWASEKEIAEADVLAAELVREEKASLDLLAGVYVA